MRELFGPVFGTTGVDAVLDDGAWVAALCEVETALARACNRAGLIHLSVALEIGVAADRLSTSDPAELGAEARAGGNPVVALVERLRELVRERGGADAAAAVHLGATSQDVMDTASILLTSRALGVVRADLNAAADLTAGLARTHRDTPMYARTLLQQAVPTTFGAVAAGWGTGLDRAVGRLDALRAQLPVQLGGAGGTLAALHPHGFAVQEALADELELVVPLGVWHTERGLIAELAGALGTAAVAVAKPATDIVLLAQSELGEVSEGSPGGSSSMPHKRNAIAAVTARAAAAQVPGLVATLLACGAHELQRAAGPWHAEWPALDALLRCVGGAAARLQASLDGLVVDAAAMRSTLDADDPDTGHAGDLVDRYLDRRAE